MKLRSGIDRAVIFTAVYLMAAFTVSGQGISADTLIVYHVHTDKLDTIFPVEADSSKTFDFTASYPGSLGRLTAIPSDPPPENVFDGSSFSRNLPAADFFEVTDYPVRAAIKIEIYREGQLEGVCSGTLVSENAVLTAGHCLRSFEKWPGDSLVVLPAFNNGKTELPESGATRYYLFKDFFDGSNWLSRDIALIELDRPIGKRIGWIGMGFSKEESYFSQRVFHKFSYPAMPPVNDPDREYNGDTMYYNYGYIDREQNNRIFVRSSEIFGIGGQSGSPLYCKDEGEYIIHGIMVLGNYMHIQIGPEVFYSFKNAIENHIQEGVPQREFVDFIAYPNPFAHKTTIAFENPTHRAHRFELYDTRGRLVQKREHFTEDEVEVQGKGLSEGMYIFRIYQGSSLVAVGKISVTR